MNDNKTLLSVLEQLRIASLRALKSKDGHSRSILNTIISFLLVDGKNPDPNEGLDRAYSLLKQYKKALVDGGDVQSYIDTLLLFIDPPMDEEAIKELVKKEGFTSMKEAVSWLKDNSSIHLDKSLLKKAIDDL